METATTTPEPASEPASESAPTSASAPAPRCPYRGGLPAAAPPAPKCAWVVLLMLGKAYAPGALVVAHSLRALRTRHDLVCMVTPDVPEETRAQLAGTTQHPVYDRVVEVPYIQHATRRFASARQEENYGGWIDRSFTKWNCLAFVEYDRVLLIDADMLAVANCDDLFELAPPAAAYSNPWATPWLKKGGLRNPYVPPGEADLAHGARVPAARISAAIRDGDFVGGGGLVLLEPDAAAFARYLENVHAREVFGEGPAVSGSDEVSIAGLYPGADWTNIHQRYSAIPWKKEWVCRDIRAYHYLGRKPWLMSRDEWPDLADWWDCADRLIAVHPALRETFYPLVTEVTPLDAECAQIRLVADLRALILGAAKRDCDARGLASARREVNNVLERWVLAMANAPADPAAPSWAGAFRVSTLEDGFNNKLAGELVEKRFVRGATAAGEVVAQVAALVSRRMATLPYPTGARLACEAGVLSYGPNFRAELGPRLRRLVELGGEEAAARVAMRYAAAISAGQQWGLPQAHVDRLYEEFGVRNEAFASPLNARLLDKAGARFCSAFPDTDSAFGSIGDFFAQDPASLDGNWVVNPPFIEELLARAARHVIDALARALARGVGQTYFFIVPAWADSEAHQALLSCPFLAATWDCVPGQYYFEDPAGARADTKARSTYFALSTEPLEVRQGLSEALRDISRAAR